MARATDYQAKLEEWGLDPLEAQVYLTLVRNAQSVGASALASAAGIPRPSVYPILKALVEKGIVQNDEGYGSQFAAVPPSEALPRVIAFEKEKLGERELLTAELVKDLRPLTDKTSRGLEAKLVEILRHPQVCAERFQKLQLEAKREVNVLVKEPLVITNLNRSGNPTESESLRRGIKHRVIYESALLDHDYVAPFLKKWIEAGEDARVYNGDLPFKAVLFDREIAWLPLETTEKRHPVVSVLIRHRALGNALGLLFDYLWKESKPIRFGRKRVRNHATTGGADRSSK
jgi:sugar-specific transcriptional regulator TrmB